MLINFRCFNVHVYIKNKDKTQHNTITSGELSIITTDLETEWLTSKAVLRTVKI